MDVNYITSCTEFVRYRGHEFESENLKVLKEIDWVQ